MLAVLSILNNLLLLYIIVVHNVCHKFTLNFNNSLNVTPKEIRECEYRKRYCLYLWKDSLLFTYINTKYSATNCQFDCHLFKLTCQILHEKMHYWLPPPIVRDNLAQIDIILWWNIFYALNLNLPLHEKNVDRVAWFFYNKVSPKKIHNYISYNVTKTLRVYRH